MTTFMAPRPGDEPDDTSEDGLDHRDSAGDGAAGDQIADGTGAARPRRIPRPGRPADEGMATAEYAVATLAAVGFAGLLLTVLRSGEVQEMLLDLVRRALAVAG
ncbi:MAG: DUF4244 domain-containing protein [Kineosporiaceae bacterium]